MKDPLDKKRGQFLALSADIPAHLRLIERSEGNSLLRKARKLTAFGGRYLRWAAARAGMKPGLVAVPLFWGKSIQLPYVDTADFVAFYLSGAPDGPEYKLARYFIRTLKSGDVFYDVGANYGFYTLLAAEFTGSSGEVHAFEPMPEIQALLVKNAAGTQARIVDAALWDRTGAATLYRHHLGDVFNTLEAEVADFDPSRGQGKTEVRCITLDDYVKSNRPPTVIKIDVEGGEKRMLAGATGALHLARPIIAMEVWGGEVGKRFSLPAVRAVLDLGYKAHSLEEDGGTAPLPAEVLEDFLQDMPAVWDNLIFFPA